VEAQLWAAAEKARYEEKGKIWSKFAGRMGMPTATKMADAHMDWSFTESQDLDSHDSETQDSNGTAHAPADEHAVEQSQSSVRALEEENMQMKHQIDTLVALLEKHGIHPSG
jgi:hypothetical protein